MKSVGFFSSNLCLNRLSAPPLLKIIVSRGVGTSDEESSQRQRGIAELTSEISDPEEVTSWVEEGSSALLLLIHERFSIFRFPRRFISIHGYHGSELTVLIELRSNRYFFVKFCSHMLFTSTGAPPDVATCSRRWRRPLRWQVIKFAYF